MAVRTNQPSSTPQDPPAQGSNTLDDNRAGAIETLLRRSRRLKRDMRRLASDVQSYNDSRAELGPPAEGEGFSSDVRAVLEQLERETGQTGEELLLKSLSFYSRAWQAERFGQKIAILDPDDTVVLEFVGFGNPLRDSVRVEEP